MLGSATLVGVSRNQVTGKLCNPVQRIVHAGILGGQALRAVVAHQGQNVASGHWMAFVLSDHAWYKVDSMRVNPLMEDPFLNQIGVSRQGSYTLDMFIFSR